MATTVSIPVHEYLTTTYRPDCDYIDGELRERHLGTRPHAALQGILYAILHANRRLWKVIALPEQRVQVSATRFRVPDVCVLASSDPAEAVVRKAPMICFEVLSPEDNLPDMQERAEDYEAMGVGRLWVLDPIKHKVWIASSNGLQKVYADELVFEGTPIRINLNEVFAELDELTGGSR